MITLSQVYIARGTKVLLNEADLSIFEKQKVGLIGHNGCGKSSLFSLLLNQIKPDTGDIQIHQQTRVSHLEQQLPNTDMSAIDFVLEGDREYTSLMNKLALAESSGEHEEVVHCYERLTQINGYARKAEAATIIHGLGFKAEEQDKPVNSFSGGWRMRLNLARCLIEPSDLLLLDEPTNHLDLEAVLWLEQFLKNIQKTLILISHDREFLDVCVTHIVHFHDKQLQLYKGNYSSFEKQRAQQLMLQQAQYTKQQTQIKHLMSFVTRFKAKASKAKQAQSRVKMIERMELVAQAQFDSPFSFRFLETDEPGNPLMRCEFIDAGYDTPIIKNINFTLNQGDRIALLGPNGAGKSTFIKTLTETLAPLSGELFKNKKLNIGYFAQHQMDELNAEHSPLQTLMLCDPDAKEQTLRDFLGGFDFRGKMADTPITNFSGGEKARLALAKLIWKKPNLLLLDEPTNHLDLEMRSALEMALQTYTGALILITHDRHLLKTCVDNLYVIYAGKFNEFKGDLDEYHPWLMSQKVVTKTDKPQEKTQNFQQQKAQKNRIKKLEQLMEQQSKNIQDLEAQLAAPEIYEESATNLRNELIKKLETCQNNLSDYESEWLTLCD